MRTARPLGRPWTRVCGTPSLNTHLEGLKQQLSEGPGCRPLLIKGQRAALGDKSSQLWDRPAGLQRICPDATAEPTEGGADSRSEDQGLESPGSSWRTTPH